MRSRKAEQGFTLLELLVSITIAGVAFVILLSGFGQNIKATGLAEDYTTASFLARSLVADLEARSDLNPGKLSGDFGDNYPRFSWDAEVSPLAESDFLSLQANVVFTRSGVGRELSYRYVLPPVDKDDKALR